MVISFLKELLSFRSITPNDAASLEFIARFLPDFEAKFIEKNGTKNLILSKIYGDGEHLAFAGHVDVVPPGDGWQSEPFTPLEKDGYIYARGAQDMKSGVAAFVCAAKEAKFDGKLSLILTSDEEDDGTYGTPLALEYLRKINDLPKFCVVAEPTCDKEFGDSIKVGRRGSINGKIVIKGIQGHVAYPEKCINPVNLIAPLLNQIADHDMDAGSEFFGSSKIVVTDIRGGMQVCNVTPSELSIMFNVRNSNLTDINDVESYLREVLKGLDFELSIKQSSKRFLTNKDSKIVKNLMASVAKITGITPVLNTKGGTSDARHFSEFGVDAIEFGVINDRIHAKNERVSVREVNKLYEIFKDLIEKF